MNKWMARIVAIILLLAIISCSLFGVGNPLLGKWYLAKATGPGGVLTDIEFLDDSKVLVNVGTILGSRIVLCKYSLLDNSHLVLECENDLDKTVFSYKISGDELTLESGSLLGTLTYTKKQPTPTLTSTLRPTFTPIPSLTPTPRPLPTITVVSDLPMTGSSLGQTQTIVNAITQAFESKGNKVCDGKWAIIYKPYDDASAARGAWDPEVVTKNAREYAANTNIVLVIGTFNSGAARLMIPILNPENLVMVSPGNTYPGLTKPGKGEKDEPDKYYPNKTRNYSRVVPADDVQGAVGAKWAKDLGAKSVYILDDQELYGKGIADVFEKSAKDGGLNVLGHEGIDGKAADYKALATKINDKKPDLVYFGGITQNNAGQLFKDIRNVGFKGLLMGPDGIYEEAFVKAAGDASENVYVTFGGLPVDKYTGKAAEWRDAYKTKFKSDPEVYAVYGYVAAQVAMDAFERVCKNGKALTDRAAVREAVFATKDLDSVLGKFSLDANGDTTDTTSSGIQIKKGKFEFVTPLK